MSSPTVPRRGAHPGSLLSGVRRSAVVLTLTAAAPQAFADCQIQQVAELKVQMKANVPIAEGQINGHAVKVLVDSGGHTLIVEPKARELGLTLKEFPQFSLFGVSGKEKIYRTDIDQLQIGTFQAKNFRLAVVGADKWMRGSDIGLILGEDFLSNFVTEFDLAHGAIRLLQAPKCRSEQMIYWNQPYSLAHLSAPSGLDPHINVEVKVNGRQVLGMLDSGSSVSSMTRSAAAQVGATTGANGGPIATVDSLSIGDETVRNVKLRTGDLFSNDKVSSTGSNVPQHLDTPSLIIGGDFLLSHRVLVRYKERELLFTYNGGPIFQAIGAASPTGSEAAKPSDPSNH